VQFPHAFVHSFFLGHATRCARENVDDFRRALAVARQAA